MCQFKDWRSGVQSDIISSFRISIPYIWYLDSKSKVLARGKSYYVRAQRKCLSPLRLKHSWGREAGLGCLLQGLSHSLGMTASSIATPSLESQLSSAFQLSANVHPGRQWGMVQVLDAPCGRSGLSSGS